MNAIKDDEYETERLTYMWYVSYSEDRDEDLMGGRIELDTPRSDYSRYSTTFMYTKGKDSWIRASETYNVKEMR